MTDTLTDTPDKAVLTAVPPVEEEEAFEPISFDVVSPLRKAKVIKVELEGTDKAVFVREWTTKVLFGMIKRVQKVVDILTTNGVLNFKPTTEGDEPQADRNMQFINGVMVALGEGEQDVYEVLKSSVFQDTDCKAAVDADWLGELTLADTVLLVKAVWFVNWEAGSLKKDVTAPSIVSKKAKPKKH